MNVPKPDVPKAIVPKAEPVEYEPSEWDRLYSVYTRMSKIRRRLLRETGKQLRAVTDDPHLPGWDRCFVCGRQPEKSDLVGKDCDGRPGFEITCTCGRKAAGTYSALCDRWNNKEYDCDGVRPFCNNPQCPFPNPVRGGGITVMGKYRTIYRCMTCETRWYS